MPHKRAKRSLRLAASEAKGVDNPPTAADSLLPITTTTEGKEAAGTADGEKRNKKRKKAGSSAGPVDTGGMSKSAFRILNAAKLREEYHAKKKRKVEEETKGKNPNQQKKPSTIQPLPYESLSSFNHRVEQEMRHSVRTAIKDASNTAQKRKDRKGKAKQTADEDDEEEEEDSSVTKDKNGKPVAKKAKPTPEESLDPFAKPKVQREQQQLEQAKSRSGRTEFAAADLRRRIDDVVQAPPTLADPARKGLMQKVLGPGGAAACGTTSEGPGTFKLAGPDAPVGSSRLPINPAMKAMLPLTLAHALRLSLTRALSLSCTRSPELTLTRTIPFTFTRPQPRFHSSLARSYATMPAQTSSDGGKWKVALIGSGNWGSAIARLVGKNIKERSDEFDTEVKMWCYEEDFEGRKLTEVINEKHENVKYLPGIDLGDNVVAEPDLIKAIEGANALIFVIPHQFIIETCKQLEGKVPSNTQAISLVKGVDVKDGQIHIFSEVIKEHLDIECAALSGANIANEVAKEAFSETTIGCRDIEVAKRWARLFETEKFRVAVSKDVLGVSLGGALKNVVAVAAGLIDGLQWGNNAKAAIMRIGLLEMKRFALEFFPGTEPETFVQESAGIADLITSCLGGRNRKCAEAFVTTGKTFDQLEKEMLNGQKLQGVQTAKELHEFLKARGKADNYPLFTFVYRVAYEGVKPDTITAHI